MSWTLTLKQKNAPGVGAHFIFSFKVQNYAGLIQKVCFHLKKSPIFARNLIVPRGSGVKQSMSGIQVCFSRYNDCICQN